MIDINNLETLAEKEYITALCADVPVEATKKELIRKLNDVMDSMLIVINKYCQTAAVMGVGLEQTGKAFELASAYIEEGRLKHGISDADIQYYRDLWEHRNKAWNNPGWSCK